MRWTTLDVIAFWGFSLLSWLLYPRRHLCRMNASHWLLPWQGLGMSISWKVCATASKVAQIVPETGGGASDAPL
jgi:hypothetical protein